MSLCSRQDTDLIILADSDGSVLGPRQCAENIKRVVDESVSQISGERVQHACLARSRSVLN